MRRAFGGPAAGRPGSSQTPKQFAIGGLVCANRCAAFYTRVLWREVLATTYYWRHDPATPKLATWWGMATSGYFGDAVAAHSYIAQHAHPTDRWSSVERYDPAMDRQARDDERTDAGLKLAYEPAPSPVARALPDRTQAAAAPMPTGLITNVAPGSAAALVGVQRGDTLVSVDGEPLRVVFARLDREDKAKAKGEPVTATARTAPPVLQVRSQGGKLIAITTRKPYKTTGVQAVSWHSKGGAAMAPGLHTELLYLRLDGFKLHTGVYAEKAIRESAQAVALPPNPSWPDPAK